MLSPHDHSLAHALLPIALASLNSICYHVKHWCSTWKQIALLPIHISMSNFIKFTYCNDIFLTFATLLKIHKFSSLLVDIQLLGWQVPPPIVITMGICGAIHNPSINSSTDLTILPMTIKKTHDQFQPHCHQIPHLPFLNKRKLDKCQARIMPPWHLFSPLPFPYTPL